MILEIVKTSIIEKICLTKDCQAFEKTTVKKLFYIGMFGCMELSDNTSKTLILEVEK